MRTAAESCISAVIVDTKREPGAGSAVDAETT